MMVTPRISNFTHKFTVFISLLSIHHIADRGGEANGCYIGIGILLGRWLKSDHGTG